MDRRKKPNKLLRVFVLLLILSVAGFFAFQGYMSYLKSPADPNGKQIAFVINPGETVTDVANELEEKGIIRSAMAFKMSAKDLEFNSANVGDFIVSASMTHQEIINALKGGSTDVRVTLLEGWRVEQIAKELNEKLKIDEKEFIAAAKKDEGYLFPDTYFFHPDASIETIISTMRNNFDRKYTAELQNKIKSQGLTPEEGVILASMVEREGRSEKVRTEVAGVLLNRLSMGMKLDIDATVQYAKDTQKLKNGTLEKFWEPVLIADYQGVSSPYNTYTNNGLPPGPIANPSLMSLTAVANADPNSPYVYYFHDAEGNSYYAKTLEEHNANVAAHR